MKTALFLIFIFGIIRKWWKRRKDENSQKCGEV